MITIDYDTAAHCFDIRFMASPDLRGGSTRNLTTWVNAEYPADGALAAIELIGDSPEAVTDLPGAVAVLGVDPAVAAAAVEAAFAAPDREISVDVGPVLLRPA